MKNVIVPLNAFDSKAVIEYGQASFVELIAKAGAYGIEIRRELLTEGNPQLDKIRSEIDKFGLFTVYSAPVECWKEDHQLNEEQLNEIFKEGVLLGAKWVKVSLGHFQKGISNITELSVLLKQQPEIQLLVENDQTLNGGTINQLQAFFENAVDSGVSVKMTFDAGNWYYSGQDVEEALDKLAPYVMYLHLKQVEKKDGTLVTVPLEPDGEHSWKKVMQSLPGDIVKAVEFPIVPIEKTKDFIEMINDMVKESEALPTCKS